MGMNCQEILDDLQIPRGLRLAAEICFRSISINEDSNLGNPSEQRPTQSGFLSNQFWLIISMDWFKGKFTGKPHI